MEEQLSAQYAVLLDNRRCSAGWMNTDGAAVPVTVHSAVCLQITRGALATCMSLLCRTVFWDDFGPQQDASRLAVRWLSHTGVTIFSTGLSDKKNITRSLSNPSFAFLQIVFQVSVNATV